MSPGFLHCALLMSLSVCVTVTGTGHLLEVHSVLGSDCVLQCTVRHKPDVRYRAVRWYKIEELPSPRLSGLLTRDLPNGPTRWYAGVEREVELLGESHHILLPNVTCGDRGLYSCHLAAPVGEQNREGWVRLTVTDCTDMSDTYIVIGAIAMLALALGIFLVALKEIPQRQKPDDSQEDVIGRIAETAGRKGPKVDLHFGSQGL